MSDGRLRHADFYIDTVAVCCRHCGELLDEPKSGSTVWTLADVRGLIETAGHEIACRCGGRVYLKLPLSLKTREEV